MSVLFDSIGLAGVACFLLAYGALQAGKLKSDDLAYLGLNLSGAVLVMISLLASWNTAAFLLEAAWAIISIYGIVKTLRKRGAGNS